MRPLSTTVKALTCALFILTLSAIANAQMSRTWVSSVGDDSNICSRTAPCRTFTGAILKTTDKGEIDCVDPGSFGTVTITKNVTIDGRGTVASILATNSNGIVISDAAMVTPQTIVVVLRNLTINGGGTGLDGIRFLAGKALQVENCVISGFGGNGVNSDGIDVNLSGMAPGNQDVKVTDTVISNNSGAGIRASNTAAGTAVLVSVEASRLAANATGFLSSTGCIAQIANTYFTFNVDSGLDVGAGTYTVDVDTSYFQSNTNGIKAEAATTRIGGCRISGNANGINFLGGSVQSFGDNRVKGNFTSDQLGGAVTPVPDPVKT